MVIRLLVFFWYLVEDVNHGDLTALQTGGQTLVRTTFLFSYIHHIRVPFFYSFFLTFTNNYFFFSQTQFLSAGKLQLNPNKYLG